MFRQMILIALVAIAMTGCYDQYEAEQSLTPVVATPAKNFQDLILDLCSDPDFYWSEADSLGFYAQCVELCIVLANGDTTPVKFYSTENSAEYGLLINGTRFAVDTTVTTELTLSWNGNEYQMPLSGGLYGTAELVACSHGGGGVTPPVIGSFEDLVFAACSDPNYYWNSADGIGYYATCKTWCLVDDSGNSFPAFFYATQGGAEIGVKANDELYPVTIGGDSLWVTYNGKLFAFPLSGGLFGNAKLVECVHTSTPTTLGFADLVEALCSTPDYIWFDSLILNGTNVANTDGIGIYGTTCSAAGWEFVFNGQAQPVYFFAESGNPTTQWGLISQWGDKYYVTADPAVTPFQVVWNGKTYTFRVTSTAGDWFGDVELRKQ